VARLGGKSEGKNRQQAGNIRLRRFNTEPMAAREKEPQKENEIRLLDSNISKGMKKRPDSATQGEQKGRKMHIARPNLTPSTRRTVKNSHVLTRGGKKGRPVGGIGIDVGSQ